MIAYGKVKTRHHGKVASHRDCPICHPAEGNKAKARQESKKIVKYELEETRCKSTSGECAEDKHLIKE